MMPADFHQFCGPRAVAVLLGIHPARAATLLWRCQLARNRITAPMTSAGDLLLVLASQGRRITQLGASRELALAEITTHDTLVADLLADFHAEAKTPPPEPVELPPLSEAMQAKAAAEAQRIETRERLTLRELVEAAPGGDLLVSVGAAAGLLSHHALALCDGQVIAGDDPDLPRYGAAAVAAAWRVQPERKPA